MDTWIYSPSPRFNGNSKFPSQGGRRREEEEERKEGRKVVETSEPPSSRGLEYSAVFLRFEEDLVSRKRREKEEDKSEERDERMGEADPACQLNGTELKSFASRQARHVLAS